MLTALTHFWLTKILHFENHLVPSRWTEIGFTENAAADLKEDGLFELPLERCLVVKNLTGKMYPFEMIYRHHIGGSVFKQYQKTGIAGGHQLPLGLPKWSKLDLPIFTPSTKEAVGHDINVDANYFFAEMEKAGLTTEALETVKMLADAYAIAYKYAEERGILILDTKFEVAGGIIADEIITPDSSRFALKKDWEQALKEGRDPQFYDKQPVRDVMAKVATPFFDDKNQPIIGINHLDPENEEHVAFVHSLEIPEDVIAGTTERYLKIFEMITGTSLEDYQLDELGC